jgi:hypothetical protein
MSVFAQIGLGLSIAAVWGLGGIVWDEIKWRL